MQRGTTPVVWGRKEAIELLRGPLTRLCGPEHSLCKVAAERGIFCRGFRRWDDSAFHKRWKMSLGSSTHLTRRQMEQLADIWQLAEQLRHRVGLACDAQAIAPGACRGWDEFSNESLARFCDEILGLNVVVTETSG